MMLTIVIDRTYKEIVAVLGEGGVELPWTDADWDDYARCAHCNALLPIGHMNHDENDDYICENC